MPPRVSKNSSKAAGGVEQNSHQRDSLDQNATASALASARARLKKWIRMPPILQIVDPIYEAALSFHENKPYLIYSVLLYCLICFAFPFQFLEMLWHLVVKYFIDTPRDWCFSLSHFIMTTLMAWDPRVRSHFHILSEQHSNTDLQFYVDHFFNSGLLPVLDLFIPMRVEVDSESMTKPFMRSAMWNATAAQTMAEYPSSSVMEQLNDTQKRIRQLQEWINGNATAMNNFTHALTEPEIKDMFDKNHRFLQQIRHSASEFMCGMRIGEDSKAIAHLHAVTMVNCIFIYIMLFLAWCTRLKMRRNVYVQYSIRLISGIFSTALLNCFAFPTPLVRTMPFHFSDLCINTRSASKLLAETFEPYM